MKIRYLGSLSLMALLAGCVTDGPTSYVDSVRQADGQLVYRAQCHGMFESSKSCYGAASKICGDAGYRELSSTTKISSSNYQPTNDPRVLVFACGPAQPAPQPVPQPLTKRFTLDANVLFAFDGASLNHLQIDGRRVLEKLTGELHADYRKIDSLVVTGYTDRIGSDSYNLALSRDRAEAVRAYLVDHGIAAGAISAHGLGKADPVTTGCPAGSSTEAIACLAPDRRVVIDVTGEQVEPQ